jgi:hypothetical protein
MPFPIQLSSQIWYQFCWFTYKKTFMKKILISVSLVLLAFQVYAHDFVLVNGQVSFQKAFQTSFSHEEVKDALLRNGLRVTSESNGVLHFESEYVFVDWDKYRADNNGMNRMPDIPHKIVGFLEFTDAGYKVTVTHCYKFSEDKPFVDKDPATEVFHEFYNRWRGAFHNQRMIVRIRDAYNDWLSAMFAWE